jgi:hypothetical protein
MNLSKICFVVFFFKAPKVVRFESKWIKSLSLIVKLSLAIGCLYLMCQRSSYQIFDRSPISAVTIKVKQSSNCSNNSLEIYRLLNYTCSQSLYDVNDFILPPTENSAISITTRITETEHILTLCNNTIRGIKPSRNSSIYATAIHKCEEKSRCILPPIYRDEDENGTIILEAKLCWFKLRRKIVKRNYQALDYILFIKHFVEFTQLGLVRNNLVPDIIKKNYIRDCEYDSESNSLCPNFRISKIFELIKPDPKVKPDPKEYEAMLFNGSLIEIKISWKCNLDQLLEYCEPHYEFRRLDITPYQDNPFYPGSTFLTSRHFFEPNDNQLHRVHTNIYNLHIIVSVTGEVGKFDLFQTTTSIGSFLGIIGMGTIVCDLIAAFFTNFKSLKYDS